MFSVKNKTIHFFEEMMAKNLEGNCPKFKADATSNRLYPMKLITIKMVIYFYPKDSTPGCTTEGKNLEIATKFKN